MKSVEFIKSKAQGWEWREGPYDQSSPISNVSTSYFYSVFITCKTWLRPGEDY